MILLKLAGNVVCYFGSGATGDGAESMKPEPSPGGASARVVRFLGRHALVCVRNRRREHLTRLISSGRGNGVLRVTVFTVQWQIGVHVLE